VKEKNDSYGLANMQERALAAKFGYKIETGFDKGTTVIITASA
jgi:signal transduction histidine kinase